MPLQRKVAKVITLSVTLAERLEAEAAEAVEARGRFSIAVPGGSVAPKFFPRLSTASIDWTRTDFFQVDERAVPPGHPDSNYDLLSSLWLAPAGVPRHRIHRMEAEDPDLYAAATRYARDLVSTLGDPPRLDVLLLGVGPDGHVASLFPGHPALAEAAQLVVPVFDSPKPPPRRLTLTMKVLTAARLVVIVMTGTEKAPVVRRLEEPDLPVGRVAREAERVLLLLDHEAAG